MSSTQDEFVPYKPHAVTITKGPQGFGFNVRGQIDEGGQLRSINGSLYAPLQHISNVVEGGPADVAGVLTGDRILEVNGRNVEGESHSSVIELIKSNMDVLKMVLLSVPAKENDRLDGEAVSYTSDEELEHKSIEISIPSVSQREESGKSVSYYNVYLDGAFLMSHRYNEFHRLHVDLKNKFPYIVFPRFPGKWPLKLSQTQLDKRHQELEHWLKQVCSVTQLFDHFYVQDFLGLVGKKREERVDSAPDNADIKVLLPNNTSLCVNIPTEAYVKELIEAVCTKLNISLDFVPHFTIFKRYDGDEFPVPCLPSEKPNNLLVNNHNELNKLKLSFRKLLLSPEVEASIGLFDSTGKEIELKRTNHVTTQADFVRVAQTCPGYNGVEVPHCACDSRKDGHVILCVSRDRITIQACSKSGEKQDQVKNFSWAHVTEHEEVDGEFSFTITKDPSVIPVRSHKYAASKRGFNKLGTPLRPLSAIPRIDLVVVATVAVCGTTGARLGKGKGYGEVEYGVTRGIGSVTCDTPVMTIVHDIQVALELYYAYAIEKRCLIPVRVTQNRGASSVRQHEFVPYKPHAVTITKGPQGFGFNVRGQIDEGGQLRSINGSLYAPLQHISNVVEGGPADEAGVLTGDRILEVNGRNVEGESHSSVIELIKSNMDVLKMVLLSVPAKENDRLDGEAVSYTSDEELEHKSIEISIPSVSQREESGKSVSYYNVYLDGAFLMSHRYNEFHRLHVDLKNKFPYIVFPRFPGKWPLKLSQTQLDKRHQELEHWLKQVCSVTQLFDHFYVQDFLGLVGKKRAERVDSAPDNADIKVLLPNNTSLCVNIPTEAYVKELIEAVCTKLNISLDFVPHFTIFKRYDGDEFPVPCLPSEKPNNLLVNNHNELNKLKLSFRKLLLSPEVEASMLGDTAALEILYNQAVSDYTSGLFDSTGKEIELNRTNHVTTQADFVRVAQTCPGYNGVEFPHCACDSRKDGHVILSVSRDRITIQACSKSGEKQDQVKNFSWAHVTEYDEVEGEFSFTITKGTSVRKIVLTSQHASYMNHCFQLGRIPNFYGSKAAAYKLCSTPEFRRAKVIKIHPSLNAEPLRTLALKFGKTVLTPPLPGHDFLYFSLDPSVIPVRSHKYAASKRGFNKLGTPLRPLSAIPPIDLVVVATVAVCGNTGARLGKGKGYGEVEYGVTRGIGSVICDTPVITIVHDVQVIGEGVIPDLAKHDLPVDVICTPTRIIRTSGVLQKPEGIIWDIISEQMYTDIGVLRELKKMKGEGD
eukprot:sb/3461148/